MKRCLLLAGCCLLAYAEIAEEPTAALRPPRGEMYAGFWEKYGWTVVIGIVVVLGGISLLIQWRKRLIPRVAVPPEIAARRGLHELRGQKEDVTLTLKVSRILRNYLGAVFQFPPEEYTTSEVSKALKEQSKLDLTMTKDIETFLRRCDERKFAPASTATQFDPAEGSSAIVEKVETHRRKVAAEAQAALNSAKS